MKALHAAEQFCADVLPQESHAAGAQRIGRMDIVTREVAATFQVVSDSLKASELARRIGLQNAEFHERGDLISPFGGKHYYQNAILRLQSQARDDASISDHLENLLQSLRPFTKHLALLPSGCLAEVRLKVSFEQSQLGFELPAEKMRELAQMNIGLVFDIYCLTE